MGTLETLTGRNYLSYSALSSWLDCGERYRLERVLDAPQTNAWYFIAGDVIHKATEDCDIDGITDPAVGREYFNTLWQSTLRTLRSDGVDFTKFKIGGRKTTMWPERENEAFWVATGPDNVANWVRTRTHLFEQGWQFYIMPDGSSSIEVPVEITLNEGADDEVKLKGYIDRVMVDPHGQVHVIDLKSGSQTPISTLQLGTYAVGFAAQYGVTPSIGAYYMTRKGEMSQAASLMKYTPELLGKWFGSAKRAIEAEVFIPKVGPFCNSCSVAQFCEAQGGDPSPLKTRVF
jgi:CRISPR/Cas system-associated exonuclease Cas4 (RecB family)